MAQMGTVILKVTPEQLRMKSDEIRMEIGLMKTAFDELTNRISKTSYYWKVAGGDHCRALYEKDKSRLNELFLRLEQRPRNLLEMAQIYSDAENAAEGFSEPLNNDIIQ